jgi:hypothetical protein
MRVFWTRYIILVAIASVGVPWASNGQSPSVAGFSLVGIVIDTLGVGVPFAHVMVYNSEQATVADNDGRFRLEQLPVARTRVAVRRIGYAPVYFDVDVPVASTVEVEVRMRQNVPVLTTVEISDEVTTPLQKVGFYERLAAGHGLFVTPEMLAAMRPVRASDALNSIPNVVVDRRGSRTRITSSRQQCEYALVVDKIRVGQPGSRVRTTTPDDAVSAGDLYAIEVYPRNRGLPAQFLGLTSEDGCGTIVIWTKGMIAR